MKEYELLPLFNGIKNKYKESWEQSRLISYIVAQTQSTKKLKPTDIIKFEWDDDNVVHDTSVSNEDVERLKKKAQNYKLK